VTASSLCRSLGIRRISQPRKRAYKPLNPIQ